MKEFQPDLPSIVTDGSQLQQVFINMVDNAIDAINKDGVIRLTTKGQDKGVLISIADTGPGMPEELQKKIFDPFFTTKLIGKGTGLGLSTSYDIVEKLGGRLTVKSELGKGTTFYIALPPSCEGAGEKVGG